MGAGAGWGRSESGSQSGSSGPSLRLSDSRISAQARVVVLVVRFAVGSALVRAVVIQEVTVMVAPRLPWVLEELVYFLHPNESEYPDT